MLAQGEVAMSVITFGELQYGAQKSTQRKQVLKMLDKLSLAIPVLQMTADVGAHYGEIHANLQKLGTPIGNNDIWIAAHAKAIDLVLVTNNVREFERVIKLRIKN